MKKLYLDIETAPNVVLAWGLFNQNISINQIVKPGYTLCWAAKWEDEKEIMFSSVWGDGETKMLKRMHKLLSKADAVIHYNGKSFDMPILNKEFIKHRIHPPTPYQQIDLLQTARYKFKFTSNKLDYVAQFLGLGSKTQHKGMSLWVGCMEGNKRDLKIMEKYNKQDVRLLPKVYNALLPWIQNHPNENLYHDLVDKQGEHVTVCTNCGSSHIVRNGTEKLATQCYQRYKCMDCGTPLRGRSTVLDADKRKSVIVQSKL